MIDTYEGHTVTTTGPAGHGIVAYQRSTTAEPRIIEVGVGGRVDTSGAGAKGVQVGTVDADEAPVRVAAIGGSEGYRQQTVTVNGSITSAAEGVYLAGGGKVVIGPLGSIDSSNGIAILATGTVPAVGATPAILPKLHVSMQLNGRRVADVIGDDWIINDGGETTIAVNNVVLHDGATGVVLDADRTPIKVVNGAWDVTMKAEGVTVEDRTNPAPANWILSSRAADVIVDRDFSAQDFNERGNSSSAPEATPSSPSPPSPPPGCPDGQVGTPPNCTEPEPERPMFMEAYAPRAAVYEALPDFLLRLTGPGPTRKCLSAPEEPVWVRFAGGQGTYKAERTTTGARYDLERFETEGGLSASFNDRVKGWVSVRHVSGRASVGSLTGGGQIDVRGLGSSVGGAWRGTNGGYAMGCFSYMAYTVDLASHQRGLLKAGINGRAYTLDVELGRRFALTEQLQVTPRVWVVGSRVSVDRFTDAVDARVSFADADRITGGLGVLAASMRPWGEGEVVLRGSVDLERIWSGRTTTTEVSGERLQADATGQSLLFGVQGGYRQGPFTLDVDEFTISAEGFSLGGELAVRQELGSTDAEYVSFLNLGVSF